ncbi:hypothetical protein C8Q74DRAFT_1373750 [Fomes fomentarius]|nr:hypothetical protein C8Q74DRAFT_1373750 [Fomes fomentarius]
MLQVADELSHPHVNSYNRYWQGRTKTIDLHPEVLAVLFTLSSLARVCFRAATTFVPNQRIRTSAFPPPARGSSASTYSHMLDVSASSDPAVSIARSSVDRSRGMQRGAPNGNEIAAGNGVGHHLDPPEREMYLGGKRITTSE